jgi:hypothetical protein
MQKQLLIITHALKSTEIDSYKDGCNPETRQEWELNWKGEYESLKDMAEKLGHDQESATVIDNRVIFQRLENAEGWELSEREIALWKAGKIEAYSATYDYYILIGAEPTEEQLREITGIKN